MTIEWKETEPSQNVSSLEHLLSCIGEVAAASTEQTGIGAILRRNTVDEIVVVIAGGRWWLMWTPPDYADHGLGSFHSSSMYGLDHNDGSFKEEDLISYFLFGHHGELLAAEAVDETTGTTAVSRFYQEGGRPDNVHWIPD